MFGDYIGRGSAGGVFTSPTDPNQVIKIMNLNSRVEMVRHMNRLQLQFFEELEAQQKQGVKTPGLPNISYTFTGEMNPAIMEQMRNSILDRNLVYPEDEYLSALDYSDIKGKFRYGDEYAIILMDRVGQIGSRNYDSPEPLGRRGLTPMLRHAYNMGYYVRDLWPENKGMSSTGDIIWFDPMVVPVKAKTEEDRRAQQILLEWNEDTQTRYQDAIRDNTYFDYEHKAGLFYAENNTNVSLVDVENPLWIAKARNLILNDNFQVGILDDEGNTYATTTWGNNYNDEIQQMIVNNPNGFLMSRTQGYYNNEELRNKLWKGENHDYTFWVFPLSDDPNAKGWTGDGVVMDGNYVFTDGKTGDYDTFPLAPQQGKANFEEDLNDYYLYGFTKAFLPMAVKPKPDAINYQTVSKPQLNNFTFNAESYKPPAAAIKAAKKGLAQRKEWGRGGLSPAEAKSQGIDSGVTRARKIASGKVSRHDVRRMSAFNRHRKNNRPDKKMPDGGPTAGTIAWNLWGGTSGVNWAKKKSAAMNAEEIRCCKECDKTTGLTTVQAGTYCYDCLPINLGAEDNYWLRGGCGKAAAMISEDLDQKNIPYHYEIGLAYIDEAFVGNHIVVVSEAGDQDYYGTGGAKKRWENMLISELVDVELPPSMVEDIITFQWHKVDPQEDWSVEIAGEYLPVSGPMITKDTLSMSAESYPTCYLCPKPAKIEVMTAIGMRNFCGNQCRGIYEGVDYGPDDYYISPKLEHRIEVTNYDPGYSNYDGAKRSAKLDAKCVNCDFTLRRGSFYEPHPFGSLQKYDEESEEYYEIGKCRHENMTFMKYLENDEDAWGNVILGEVTVKCPDCGFADTLQADVPIGCDNRGRSESYIPIHQLDR